MKNAQAILTSVVLAIAGWNLLETITLGKQVAALQAEIHRRDASNKHDEKTTLANTDFDRVRSVRGLLDAESAKRSDILR